MLSNIPTNMLPWLLGSLVIAFFGIRSLINYRKLKSPLSKHLMISAFAMSAALGLWAWPYIFIDSSTLLRVILILGDTAFFGFLVYQTRIIWYLALNRTPYFWLLLPAMIVAIPGYISTVKSEMTGVVGIVDGVAQYPVSSVSHVSQIILLMLVLIVGVLLLSKLGKQKHLRSKLNLGSVGLLYILSGIGGLANIILSSGTNQSTLVNVLYFAGSLIFVFVFFAIRIQKKS